MKCVPRIRQAGGDTKKIEKKNENFETLKSLEI